MSTGREWYIHTIYTVRSRENANRGIGKRSLEYHSLTSSLSSSSDLALPVGRRSRRSANGVPTVAEDIGADQNRGTNILHITLDRSRNKQARKPTGGEWAAGETQEGEGILPQEVNQRDTEDEQLVMIIGIVVGVLLTVLLVVLVALMVSRSKQEDKMSGDAPRSSSSTEPMVVRGPATSDDSSEV